MMVEVFVHQNSPLFRCHASEEAVGMIGASCRPGGDYAIDQCVESMTFRDEVSFVEHHEARNGWGISPHGRVVSECLGFDETADEPPDGRERWGSWGARCFVYICMGIYVKTEGLACRDRRQSIVALRPSFSAHVRPTARRGEWGEHGAAVRFPPATNWRKK